MERIRIVRCPNCGGRAIRRENNKSAGREHVHPRDWEAIVECPDCNYLERYLGRWPPAQLSNQESASPSEKSKRHQLGQASFYRPIPDWNRCSGICLETLLVGGSTARIPSSSSQKLTLEFHLVTRSSRKLLRIAIEVPKQPSH